MRSSETYRDDPKLSALVRVLPWTHNLIILGQSKRSEERELYLRMAVQEKWSSRELERQLRLGTFEQAVLSLPLRKTCIEFLRYLTREWCKLWIYENQLVFV